MSASASAADLAARPYTNAPPMIAAAYDWSGFYIGANGGWGSARNCWDLLVPPSRLSAKVATTRPVARLVARSAIGGAFPTSERVRQDIDLVTVRVNYRWGGPVAARY
jgi:hypothetical protein